MDTYHEVMSRAAFIYGEHLVALYGEDPPKEKIWGPMASKLMEMGATTLESLRSATWEDLERCGFPPIIARRIANEVFRKISLP